MKESLVYHCALSWWKAFSNVGHNEEVCGFMGVIQRCFVGHSIAYMLTSIYSHKST